MTPDNVLPLLRPFYFVRHGESESNLREVIAGSTDVALTRLGHAQAQQAAAALRGAAITTIYCSILSRARDTAGHISRALELPVTAIPELTERNWGTLEGQPRILRVRGVTPPGAERYQAFAARIRRGLARIPPQGNPLVVAHSGVFRVLCRLLGTTEPTEVVANCQPVHFAPPPSGQGGWRMVYLPLHSEN